MNLIAGGFLAFVMATANAGPVSAEMVAPTLPRVYREALKINANGVPMDLLVPLGQTVPAHILNCLVRLEVTYCDASGNCDRKGLLIVNKELKNDLQAVFRYMREIRFPLAKITPTNQYPLYPPKADGSRLPGWDDEAVMSDDNTNSYNPRYILGRETASLHAFGEAIDINPKCNPAIHKSGLYEPANGRRKIANKLEPDCSLDSEKGQLVVKKFQSLGWKWGGEWTDPRDSQHFQKPGINGKRVQAPHCN